MFTNVMILVLGEPTTTICDYFDPPLCSCTAYRVSCGFPTTNYLGPAVAATAVSTFNDTFYPGKLPGTGYPAGISNLHIFFPGMANFSAEVVAHFPKFFERFMFFYNSATVAIDWDNWDVASDFNALADRRSVPKYMGFGGVAKPFVWGKQWLRGWDQVYSLELSFSNYAGFEPGSFDDCIRLEHLTLGSFGQFTGQKPPIVPHNLFRNNRRLLSFNFWGTTITELPRGIFAGLTNLQMIDLRQNLLRTLPSFEDQRFLSFLRFQENKIEEVLPGTFGEKLFLDYLFSDANPIRCYQGLEPTTGTRRTQITCICPDGFQNVAKDGSPANDVCTQTRCPAQIPGLDMVGAVIANSSCPTEVQSTCAVRCRREMYGDNRVYRCNEHGEWVSDSKDGPIRCHEALEVEPETQIVLNDPVFIPLPNNAKSIEFDPDNKWGKVKVVSFLKRCVVPPSPDMLIPRYLAKHGQYGVEIAFMRSSKFDDECKDSFAKYERDEITNTDEREEGESFSVGSGTTSVTRTMLNVNVDQGDAIKLYFNIYDNRFRYQYDDILPF